MDGMQRLDDYLKTLTDKIEKKKKLLIFSSLHYRPTGEKVIEGFRYFSCDLSQLMAAFSEQNLDTITQLPYALDEDGDVDTSAVLLDLAYTESGSFIAAQPVFYQDYNPTAQASPLLLEGDAAKKWISIVKDLDQSA